jgi:GNAT superfamily N-acetyltransferase
MLRQVTGAGELRQVDQLLQVAYQSPTRERELALYPAAQPDGLFAFFDHGEPVAAAGAFAYGEFCWLGLVGTHPGYAGQGLATRLSEHILDWSREHGCVSVALDASDRGRPVYERLGFQAAGAAVELVADASSDPATIRAAAAGPAAPAAGLNGRLADLLEFDQGVFGGDRAALLRAVAADGSRVHLCQADGNHLAGYLFARGSVLGPGAARDGAAAASLVSAALTQAPGPATLIVPAGSAHLDPLLGLGLRERRRLTHMRHGELQLPGERHLLVAQTSFAAG